MGVMLFNAYMGAGFSINRLCERVFLSFNADTVGAK